MEFIFFKITKSVFHYALLIISLIHQIYVNPVILAAKPARQKLQMIVFLVIFFNMFS
jgi:hypothetical protein